MAQLLPDGLLDPAIADSVVGTDDESLSYGNTWQFDFATNRLVVSSGRVQMIEGPECLVQWITSALVTQRFRWPIFGPEYGTGFADVVAASLNPDEAQGQIVTEITDALENDPRVSEVRLVSFVPWPDEAHAVKVEMEVEGFDARVESLEFDIELEV